MLPSPRGSSPWPPASWETLGVGSALWSLPLGAWLCPETPLHALSPYARAPSPRLEASAVSTSPMLAQLAALAQLEGDLFRFRELTPDRAQFERCLAAYAGILAEHADLRRLQALVAQMREMTVFGLSGLEVFKTIVGPIVKDVPAFAEFLLSIV